MNNEEIKEFIIKNNNRGGMMYNERFVKKNHVDIYDAVITYSNEHDLVGLTFKEKVFHYVHDIKKSIILCENPNCEKPVKFKNSTIGYYKYCSNVCVGSDPKIIKQKEDKSYGKYGTKTPAESDVIKQKTIETNMKRYGSPHHFFTITNNNKKLLDEYNVENVSQIDNIKNKVKNTKFKKYGDCGYNNIEKIKKTNFEKYGVEYIFQSEKIKQKIKKKFLDKYKVSNPAQSDIVKEKMKETIMKLYECENPSQSEYIQKIKRINKINKTLEKYKNLKIIDVDYDKKEFKFECSEGHVYDISFELFQNRKRIKTTLCTVCNPVNSTNISGKQLDLLNFIKENYEKEIIQNYKCLINPYEIDIYLPDLRLAFEFNGLYWHNENFVENLYHLNKTKNCENQGVHLIHIYEDDWMFKQDIVKSRILNLFGKSERIFARKCNIKEINNDIVKDFLNKNHIQGFVGSAIKLGLFHKDELVSLMTFGSYRKAMGQSQIEGTYELLRFCNKLNTNVIGGASRLFKYFVDNYHPNEIISYADRSWSQGNLYEKLGFSLVHKTQPNYYYIINSMRKHRFNYRKDKLIKEGTDVGKTEHQIMLDRKIYRIYDSGHLKYVYKKREN
jgi:hypothetical protein